MPVQLIASKPRLVTPGSTSVSPPPFNQAFALSNWGAATSLGYYKRGVWFKKGDLPAGRIPVLASAVAQFYGVRYWSDGSLKSARLLLRDDSGAFAQGETRNYTMTSGSGTFPGGSTALVGNSGLGAALAGHDFKVAFAAVTKFDGSTTSPYGSGAFTASLTGHASTATRWTRLSSGPVADVWQGWGMATDNQSSLADPHLKLNWYVTAWKNSAGAYAAFQIGAVVAQDWWSVAGKYLLNYNAALLDGSTSIVSYSGVVHPYQSQWLLAFNDGSRNCGSAPWIGAARPTLHCTFDRQYLIGTGLIPPLNLASVPAAGSIPSYVPCGSMEHRANIDGTGGYAGRGIITQFDGDAFQRQDAAAYARARVNALAGLGVPFHYRSNRTRTRPGESVSDTANTPISLILRPKAASAYDFTAQGMPIPVDAYFDGRSPAATQDGLAAPAGGTGGWSTGGDASHAVSYSYYMALITAEEWLMEAEIDLAMNLAHQSVYGYHNGRGLLLAGFSEYSSLGVPSTTWSGLLGQWQQDNERSVGWAQNLASHGCVAIVPVDHVAFGCLNVIFAHNGDYIQGSLQYLPSDWIGAGRYYPPSGLNGGWAPESPWMAAFIALCSYSAYMISEDARWLALGDQAFNWTSRNVNAGRFYALDQYRTMGNQKLAAWNASSNIMVPSEQQACLSISADLNAASATLSLNYSVYWNSVNQPPPPLQNGDKFIFTAGQAGNWTGSLPTGATEGQVAYAVNVQHGTNVVGVGAPTTPLPSFQLSASPGGTPLAWPSNATQVNLAWLPGAAANYPVATAAVYIPFWDNYVPVHAAAVMLAKQAGSTKCTAAMVSAMQAFMAPMGPSSYSPFDMAAS